MRFVLYTVILASISCSPSQKESLKLNHIQIIGSHNSYKQAIEDPLMQIILAKDSNTIGLSYRQLPIKEQLNLGIRGLEIDLLHDPVGGRYSHPVGVKTLIDQGLSRLPYDSSNQLSKPGLKVLHVPDIDFRSHCLTFLNCLAEIKEWSDSNSDHLPIVITINPKDSGIKEPGFTAVLPFSTKVLDSLDQEIFSVFPLSKLITPDLIKGNYSSLREAITNRGWPSLDSLRGKMLFVLDAGKSITSMYINPSTSGKPMFVNVEENDPNAAFFIMNDPITQGEDIKKKVQAGFIVRTRADADTREARKGDYSRFEAAIASGAQLISTDYYDSTLSPTGNFQIIFNDKKYQRCNPVTAPINCEL
ncbi:MAG TPA: phosphatidylinositol-specific phospholipase C1-like protein [Chryseolinea sp.]|nr:phosphatidylinositol-specific phospholipase C1-like protein [Chryseolinea sp.]